MRRVAIVGGGPAGLVLAHILHRHGVDAVVLERRPLDSIGGGPKAGSIDHRTVELFEREGLTPDPVRFDAPNGVCEFRSPDQRVVFDYGALTGGRPHFIHPQHLMVDVLARALVERGIDLRCETVVEGIEATAGSVRLSTSAGMVEADIVVGADGARSTVAASLGDIAWERVSFPVRLLAVIGATGPLALRTIYATHPDGYAAQMRRTPTHTRFYLGVPTSDTPADWPSERVRDTLARRLGEPSALDGVEFSDLSLVDLRTVMPSTMQSGRCFLVGDAAHVITPFGGKGMNLAIGDAVELAHALVAYDGGDRQRLDAYSSTRLPALWRTQAFSRWMLDMVVAPTWQADHQGFQHHLGAAWIAALQHDQALARWFAHAYAGADPA